MPLRRWCGRRVIRARIDQFFVFHFAVGHEVSAPLQIRIANERIRIKGFSQRFIQRQQIRSRIDQAHAIEAVRHPVVADVMSGAPVFPGTRVPVQTLLEYLEAGDSIDEFLAAFPSVSRSQVIAFLERATTLAVTDAA